VASKLLRHLCSITYEEAAEIGLDKISNTAFSSIPVWIPTRHHTLHASSGDLHARTP